MGCCGKVLIVIAAVVAGLLYNQYRTLSTPPELPQLDVTEFWGPAAAAANYKENTAAVPFSVETKPAVIEQLVERLRLPLDLPAPLEGVGFEYGINSKALEKIVRYWRDDYLPRWPARQKVLNQFAQFKTQIQG